MDKIKPLLTVTATATGGRNGHTHASDGSVDADLSVAKEMGGPGKPGTTIHVGRMGDIKIGEDGSAAMADPFTFDKSNIEKFAKIF